ncbi:hypothetical protein JKP88DRAFT_349944 [Tribonema minus]|uniref:S1 motif domain-containing protein n=1 Tax=Tribonema minus TaxID=303371 RepID=A0A835YYC3_9STRA|nr:hypothetical protein JKP88DRAFT_349944 [Tribonema minus]
MVRRGALVAVAVAASCCGPCARAFVQPALRCSGSSSLRRGVRRPLAATLVLQQTDDSLAERSSLEAAEPAAEEGEQQQQQDAAHQGEGRVLVPLSELKTGQRLIGSVVDVSPYAAFLDCGVSRSRLIGSVVDVSPYAAFLDCGVSRRGAGGKLCPCHGFLHRSDINRAAKLCPCHGFLHRSDINRAAKDTGAAALKKGSHVSVYVKDVFPNSGRFTVTLDPAITRKKAPPRSFMNGIVALDSAFTREKVSFMRQKKREATTIARRSRRDATSTDPSEFKDGDEVVGVINKVTEKGLLVDVKTVSLLKMPIGAIRQARGGEFIENLRDLAQPGQSVRGRVVSAADKDGQAKLRLEFVDFVDDDGSSSSSSSESAGDGEA